MFGRILIRKMSQSVANIMSKAEVAEKRLVELRTMLEAIKKVKTDELIIGLTNENKVLTANIEKAQLELIRLETLHGKKQYAVPGKTDAVKSTANNATSVPAPEKVVEKTEKPTKAEKEKKPKTKPTVPAKEEVSVDVRKLDFRIGKIVDINRHPDADTLYVEKIDCGEEQPRTVVSGLVNHVPIEDMKDRIVMVLCNLKPVKMRGVTSEAMVMCASSPDKVEVLIPPTGAAPGDLVSCEGFPREPEPQLNPKKKIFETCAPDLQTNSDKVACYKGSPLVIPGKGPIVAATLKGVQVK